MKTLQENNKEEKEEAELKKMTMLTLLIIFMLALMGISCEDKCESFRSYVRTTPVYQTTESLRAEVGFEEPTTMHAPGKIYLLGDMLYINEVGKGIHVINNADPSRPTAVGFINIPGNYDMAGKGSFLYADSYVDLLVFDISDPEAIEEVNRVNGVFNNFYEIAGLWQESIGIVVDYEEEFVEEFVEYDCGFGGATDDQASPASNGSPQWAFAEASFGSAGDAGIGGSMARFTVRENHLYTVDFSTMRTFDVAVADAPEFAGETSLGWGIETIFPYEDKLFLGAQNGMHIYDVSNAAVPSFISTYEHIQSCDPVVVQDDIAYVTLRDGTECNGFTNQLEIIDVSDVRNPQLLETYPMEHPHGLGIDGSCLFICEGDFGLKIFDASDIGRIDENMIRHYEDINAFDVIPYNDVLMMIGADGLYQFSYDCTDGAIELLSSLPILPL